MLWAKQRPTAFYMRDGAVGITTRDIPLESIIRHILSKTSKISKRSSIHQGQQAAISVHSIARRCTISKALDNNYIKIPGITGAMM